MEPHTEIRATLKRGVAVPAAVWPVFVPLLLMVCIAPVCLISVGPTSVLGILLGSFVYLALALIAFLVFQCRRTARGWVMAGGPAIVFACLQGFILASHAFSPEQPGSWGSPHPPSISADQITAALLAVWAVIAMVAIACWELLVSCVLMIRYWRRPPGGACPKCRYDRTGLAPGAVCPECDAGVPSPSSPA